MQNSDTAAHVDLLGKPLVEARTIAEARGNRIVTVKIDGEPMITTADYNPDRVRVEMVSGLISKIVGMG